MELRQQLKHIFYADIYAEYCCILNKNLQKKRSLALDMTVNSNSAVYFALPVNSLHSTLPKITIGLHKPVHHLLLSVSVFQQRF